MNKFTKVIVILSLIFLSSGLLLAHNSPATGYELDIYASTPILTWIFLALAMLCGLGIIVQQVVTKGFETSQTWLSGLLVLVLSRFSFLYVPYIRGYFTWHGDNITHWGYIKDILSTGHYYSGNFYPITHTLVAQTLLVTDIPIQLTTNLSTAGFSVLFIISTYLLATVVLPKRGQQLIATVIAGTVMLGGWFDVFLIPNGWSFLMFPLVFHCYFKRQSKPSYVLPFVLLLVMYPFFHPLSSLMIIASFLAIILIKYLVNLFLKKSRDADILIKPGLDPLPFILELVIFLAWILSFSSFDRNIRQMWQQITSGGPDILAGIGDTLSKINMHGLDIVILYVKLYGTDTILIVLSLIGLVLVGLQVRKGNHGQKPFHTLDIGAAFLLFGFLYFLFLLGTPGLPSIGAKRLISYTVLFTPVLAAVALDSISQNIGFKSAKFIVLLTLLLIPATLSSMGLFSSPYVVEPNAQITHRNIQGMESFIINKDPEVICLQALSSPARLAHGVLGYVAVAKRRDFSKNASQIPNHFNYDTQHYLGEGFTDNRYFVLNDIDRIAYLTVWKSVGRFTENDFVQLENDITVSRLYDNGEFTSYYIRATGSK